MNNAKFIGGILLIVGTAIGAGMLALPLAAAQLGFGKSSLLLLFSWLIMTASAFLILEVNLWLPRNSNLVSMAKATLGTGGQIVAWIFYLLLFYSLTSAYIAGGGDFLQNLLHKVGISLPEWITSVLFTCLFGYIVYLGIRAVDYVNRGFMLTKLAVLVILIATILVFISPQNLIGGHYTHLATSFTVMLTSFGFANVIPSLRSYFEDDVKKLRLAILIGSLIPLVCYIFWDLAIIGVIPLSGVHGLTAILNSNHQTSDLVNQLTQDVNLNFLTAFVNVFTSICLATSFLGVTLSLSDFLADSLRTPKIGKGNIIVFSATFLPPLAIVIIDPNIFVSALSYAGIYCTVLLILMPALMAWRGRYRQQFQSKYQARGGKPLLATLIAVALAVIVGGVAQSI